MKAIKRVDEATMVDGAFYKTERKHIADALKRDLHMSDKVDVLQGIRPMTQPKNMTEIAYFECIDNAEFDDYEDAVANSPDPNAAKRAYSANPKPFYIKAIYSNGRIKASMLEGRELESLKKSSDKFFRVEMT